MPPKKATGAAAASKEKKAAAVPTHASYKDMIKEAILNLKERNGSSRQAIKKYVRANNKVTTTSETQFDSLFNKALKTAVEKGDFSQPKGPSGPVKLAKKESPVRKAPAPKKEKTETKPAATKAAKPKTAAKKSTTAAKPKKAAATKKVAATKPKANTKAKTTKPKVEAPAPAVPVEEPPKVLKKTASGRISKQKTTSGATKTKKAPTKKPAAKKPTPKKAAKA